ncbi:MAG: response regulator [Oxalobacteraceae bacterium]|nr:MAG: response regulator [Oxalobacteraceae bacterium]
MATSGVEALAFCAQQLPDLILLDVLMPEMSGYEVCDRLKADPHTRSVPVIFVTVQGSADDEADGFAHGAVDYIPKPFVDVVVKARVRTQLALKLASESFARSQIELFQRDKLASVGRTIAGIAQELSSPLDNALISACTLQDDLSQLRQLSGSGGLKRSDLERHLRVSEESVGLVLGNVHARCPSSIPSCSPPPTTSATSAAASRCWSWCTRSSPARPTRSKRTRCAASSTPVTTCTC